MAIPLAFLGALARAGSAASRSLGRSIGGVRISKTSSGASNRLEQLRKQLEQVPEKATEYFKRKTPKDTGNARKRTRLENGDTIHANYAYAVRLNEGYSNQNKQGMSEPTKKYVKSLIRRIAR